MEPDISQVCVLVVDDNEGHSELVRRNLRRAGITNEIVAAASGEAALDFVYCRGVYAERTAYGGLLILLDINMPGIDGVEVLRTLKLDPQKARIPVVMLTTTDDPREIKRCYELGCSVYITKPVLPEAFMDAIKKLGLFISIVELPREKGE
mgnify:CR=1 FL=1|tara:strand:- start:181 stop:633 length:453 start_codon:yes stop_codon:yes gene_type:complete